MRKYAIILALTAVSAGLTGCGTTGSYVGGTAGSIVGSVLGSQISDNTLGSIAGSVAGSVAGSAAGSAIGSGKVFKSSKKGKKNQTAAAADSTSVGYDTYSY